MPRGTSLELCRRGPTSSPSPEVPPFQPRTVTVPWRQRESVRRPPVRRTDLWRTADRRPLCFHCGAPGHIARFCPHREGWEAFRLPLLCALTTVVPRTVITCRPAKQLHHVVAGSPRHLCVTLPQIARVSLTSSGVVVPLVRAGETNGSDLRGEGCPVSRRQKYPLRSPRRR